MEGSNYKISRSDYCKAHVIFISQKTISTLLTLKIFVKLPHYIVGCVVCSIYLHKKL